jgi:carboxypeptidase Q
VCEEFGGVGAKQYFANHQKEAGNMSLVFESDLGVFQPYGMEFSSKNPAAISIMTEIMSYAAPLNASKVVSGGLAEDTDPWVNAGVPGATPYNDGRKYFNYHHTDADMISHVPSEYFETSAATLAIGIYGVSILDDLLPR